jgi:rubrerythrin
MTDINTLNERTRQEAAIQETGDRLAALLIAVYRLPLEQRKVVLAQYERNLETMKRERLAKDLGNEVCEVCQGDGYVDIDGDAGELGWDKIGEKPCPVCFPPYENFIQD